MPFFVGFIIRKKYLTSHKSMEFHLAEAAQALGASHPECKPCAASVDLPQYEVKGEHAKSDEVKGEPEHSKSDEDMSKQKESSGKMDVPAVGEAMPVKTLPAPPRSLRQNAKEMWNVSPWWRSRGPLHEDLPKIVSDSKNSKLIPSGKAFLKSFDSTNADIRLVVVKKDGQIRLVTSKVIAVHVSSGSYHIEDGVCFSRYSNVITETGSVYSDSYRPIGFCKFGGEPDMNEDWGKYVATLYKD